jgi:gluconokinase
MSAGGPWILTLDIGTSSARGIFFDGTGTARTGGPVPRRSYPWTYTPDGGMETEADLLFDAVCEILDAADAEARSSGLDVRAIATAAFWHGLVGARGDGRACTPLYAWGDARPYRAAERLRQRLDPEEAHRRTGCFLDSSYPAARLLWLGEAHADIFSRATHWMSFGEYLGLRLFGERRVSHSMASGSGLLDTRALEWDAEVLEVVDVRPDALSELTEFTPYAAKLRPEWSDRWPVLARAAWLPALGDGACANLGSGASGPSHPALTVGTTAAIRVLVEADEPPYDPRLWCYRLDRRRFVAGRALSNGGNAIAALERTLRLPSRGERERALAGLAPDAHGLTVLPWLIRERGPGSQPGGGAAVIGQRPGTTPIDLLRAWMEAIAYRIALVADAAADALGAPERIVAGGGALNASAVWREILADVIGCPLVPSPADETAARGAALVALEWLGETPDVPCAADLDGVIVRPDPERHLRYRAARARQSHLAEALGGDPMAHTVQPSHGGRT